MYYCGNFWRRLTGWKVISETDIFYLYNSKYMYLDYVKYLVLNVLYYVLGYVVRLSKMIKH